MEIGERESTLEECYCMQVFESMWTKALPIFKGQESTCKRLYEVYHKKHEARLESEDFTVYHAKSEESSAGEWASFLARYVLMRMQVGKAGFEFEEVSFSHCFCLHSIVCRPPNWWLV